MSGEIIIIRWTSSRGVYYEFNGKYVSKKNLNTRLRILEATHERNDDPQEIVEHNRSGLLYKYHSDLPHCSIVN